jgi:surface antigen
MHRTISAATAALCLLSGCDTINGMGTKQGFGTLGGAAAGGLAGSQFGSGTGKLAMTGLGIVLGALLGGEVGSSLDKADQLALQRNTYAALTTQRIGRPVAWSNPETGSTVVVTPTHESVSASGYCREFRQAVTVGGRTEKAFGAACRQPDGSWKITS